jgi:hypothetical protein
MFGPNPTACMNENKRDMAAGSNFFSDSRNVAMVAAISIAGVATLIAIILALR